MDHSSTLLRDIGLGIIFAAAASHAARLLRQPPLLGYVLGGILLGTPMGLGLVTDHASIEFISEIGLMLLLFIIGLEIDLRELAKMGRVMFVLGFVQFAACVALGLAFFRPFGFGLGGGNFDLLYLAVGLALSSTLIVVKLLQDKFETTTAAGRLTIGVLILQDVWAILFMAFQPNMLDPRLGPLLRSFAQGAVLVVLAFAVSRHLLLRLFHAAGKTPELVLLTATAWCFLICGLAQKAGLSKEMGALIAGMSISAFPYGTDVISKLGGVRDFFVTLFFVALGLKVPKPTLGTLGLSAALVAFVLATRMASVAFPARALGLGLRTGLVTALNLSQISEFSLVIIALGAGYGHVSPGLQSTVLTAMILASIAAPYLIHFNDSLARLGMRLAELIGMRDPHRKERSGSSDSTRDIVLLGCFREGLALLDKVERETPELKKRLLVVDFNPALRHGLEERGFRWVYGDLAHPQTLHHLGIEDARLVISSVSDTFLRGTSNRRLLAQLRNMAPHAKMVMTAEEAGEAEKLVRAGAHQAVIPGELTAARLFDLLREGTQQG